MIDCKTMSVGMILVSSDGKTMTVEAFSGGPDGVGFHIGDECFKAELADVRELIDSLRLVVDS